MRERPDTQAERFRREWWLLAGLWLALGALIAVVLSLERRDTEERERQQVAHQVHIVHENLERQLHAVNQALGDIVANLAQWRARPEGALPFNERLRAFSDAMTGVRTLTVLDAEGTVVASSRAELLGENFAYRDYFQSARRLASREQPSLIVSAPMRTVLGIWAITLSRPVVAEDGLPGGVVAATLDPDEFKTLLDSVRYAPDVESTLVHGDGVRFLRVPERAGLLGATLAQPGTLFQAHLDSGRMESLFVGAMEPDPTERLVALRTIFPAHLHMDKPLVAAVARDWSQVFAAWRARAWTLGVAWLLTGVAIGLGLGFMQRRRRQLWRREQALAAQEAALQARWQAVLHATQQGVWDWDVASGTVYFSPVWKTMLGYAEGDIGDSLQEWESRVHPDDLARVHADVARHLAGETAVYENVHRLRCKDGSYKWVQDRGQVTSRDASGRPTRLIGTHTDVTAQRQHQETLDRLAENVPGALYQYQREPDGRSHFPYASPGVQDIYGLAPQALCVDAEQVFARIHPDDLQALRESLLASAQTLELWRTEYRVLVPGERERWVSGQARPARTASGAVLWHGYIHDVTLAKQQALQQQETERLLTHLMQEMPIGLCMINAAGVIYFRNRRFLDLFGYTEAEVPTLQQWWLRAYPDPHYREQVIAAWNADLAQAGAQGGEIADREYRVTDRDGRLHTMTIGGLAFGDHCMATFVDVTEQRAQHELLRKLAFMDGLTGLANRRQLDRTLKAEWRRCRRSGQPLSVVMVDIDHFKQFNDLYGHQQGDDCLRAVAAALRGGLGRSHDLVARYGGEEFVCLLPECDLDGARAKAQALCRAVHARQMEHRGSPIAPVVTVSAGVACVVPGAEDTPEQLLARADANLYRAKAAGRNRVHDGMDSLS